MLRAAFLLLGGCSSSYLDEESYLSTYKQISQYLGPFAPYDGPNGAEKAQA